MDRSDDVIGLGVRFLPVRLAAPPLPPPLFLAQAQIPFKVAVVDVRGNAMFGVDVRLADGQSAKTDSAGIATFERPPAGPFNVEILVEGLRIVRRASPDEALLVDLPICGTPKFLTNTEIIALIAGTALAGAGIYWKVEPLAIAGEVLFGAGAFTAIYRHSCVW